MPPQPDSLQKAFFEIENGERMDFMFNPSKFEVTGSNRWDADVLPGKDFRQLRFGGAGVGSFRLSLVFDTTGTGEPVTKHTNRILKLLELDENREGAATELNNLRPPWVIFHWGTDLHSFKAVIVTAHIAFTYFSNAGRPLRANVDVQLNQLEPKGAWGPQNPTSHTPRPSRSHQVRVGDSLDRIAATYYGDPTKWRDIALANGIADPLDVAPGRMLAIPERST